MYIVTVLKTTNPSLSRSCEKESGATARVIATCQYKKNMKEMTQLGATKSYSRGTETRNPVSVLLALIV